MGKLKNIEVLASLKKKITPKTAFVLTDYSRVTHQQLENLRRMVKEKGADFQIVKNSLLKLILKDIFQMKDEDLTKILGPHAVFLSNTGDPSPLKLIYSKGKELEALAIKWGMWDGHKIEADEVVRLANLPTKEVLLSQLVSQLKNNQSRLVWVLKGNLNKLAIALGEIQKKKSN